MRDLPKMDFIGSCDPYYKFFLDNKQVEGGSKTAIKNKKYGTWTFTIKEKDFEGKKIKIEIWDKDRFKKDDFIGDFECTLAELKTGNSGFKKLNGKKAKKAVIDLTYKKIFL